MQWWNNMKRYVVFSLLIIRNLIKALCTWLVSIHLSPVEWWQFSLIRKWGNGVHRAVPSHQDGTME
jgi:hypothetical protein